jgi:CheY-like chemotaxis protein
LGQNVLVAHESAELRRAARRILEDAGYAVVEAADGNEALALAADRDPVVIVLDVALPGVLGYAVVEELRRRKAAAKIILVASVYSRTGYKRRPTSLYGADDYVEQHHVADQLLLKIAQLAPGGVAPRIGPPDPVETAEIRRAGEGRLRIRASTREEGTEGARRVARLIISDIALYNGAAFEEGMRAGDLALRIRDDLAEARLLFDLRVPEEIRRECDFIAQALEEFVRERQGGR